MNKDILVVIEHLCGQVAEISYIMLAAARRLAEQSRGEVIALLLGHNARELAGNLAADKVLYVDHPDLAEFTPDTYLSILPSTIDQNNPRSVLLGHTSMGMDVASGLSARLGLPLVSQCQAFDIYDDSPTFLSQICGGKIMAEGPLPEPIALVTMVPGIYKPEQGRGETMPEIIDLPAPLLEGQRIRLLNYIEPEVGDVDITKESLLIAVGRGLQNQADLELVEEFAQAIGGTVCASRPLVDQRWLPASRLVGKSGRSVKPSLYLALGISGAPEHVQGISGSKLIIAVNTDPEAPIFEVAQYGVEVDMLDLVEAMNSQLQQVQAV